MAQITVSTMPPNREDAEISEKYKAILEDRNKAVAKQFKMEPLDVKLKFYLSAGALRSIINSNGDHMGVFAGYVEGQDAIMLTHPASVVGLFTDLEKQMLILVDYCLIKFYLCKKYFPERKDFVMYHKHVSDVFADIMSGKFTAEIVQFDIKMFSEGRRFSKEQELRMALYIMLKKSGADFVYENLDQIMKDLDIKKSIFPIYKKSYEDLVGDYKKEKEDYEKQLRVRKNR